MTYLEINLPFFKRRVTGWRATLSFILIIYGVGFFLMGILS